MTYRAHVLKEVGLAGKERARAAAVAVGEDGHALGLEGVLLRHGERPTLVGSEVDEVAVVPVVGFRAMERENKRAGCQ